jgi:maltose alpha-D-glucosyltransferase / alpha-amylase
LVSLAAPLTTEEDQHFGSSGSQPREIRDAEAYLTRPPLSAEQFNQLSQSLPARLADFLMDKRWFGGKARQIRAIHIDDIVPIAHPGMQPVVAFACVVYEDGPPETYAIPLLAQKPADRDSLSTNSEPSALDLSAVPLSDALQRPEVLRSLYDAIERQSFFSGWNGEIRAFQTTAFSGISLPAGDSSQPKLISSEQSNSSSIFGNRSILKIFRRVQEGINPELEVGRFLTERAHFAHVPPLGGWLECRTSSGKLMTLGVLQGFVANEGDAWQYTLKSLSGFWREALNSFSRISNSFTSTESQNPEDRNLPTIARELCGPYLDRTTLLGQRTAEMHIALASDNADPAFAPEPYTAAFQRQLESSLCANAIQTFDLLRSQLPRLSLDLQENARAVLSRNEEILDLIHETLRSPLSGLRTRIHGDYHLGQVLCTADDFVIIDFEGEPGRPIADRVVKRSALQDVAGMLRSFHYAAVAPLLTKLSGVKSPDGDNSKLFALAEHWNRWVSRSFLSAYFRAAGSSTFLPANESEIAYLLRLNLMAKALFEISYELNNRPDWVRIPLAGVLQLLDQSDTVLPASLHERKGKAS